MSRSINASVIVCAAVGPLCGGCGDLSELGGVYVLDTWTRNDTGCEAEGASILETEGAVGLFIEVQSFGGVEFLAGATCTTLDECHTEAASDDVNLFGGWLFDKGSDDDGWTGTITFASGSDTCSGGVTEHVMTSPADGAIRIETRSRESAPFAPDGDGECTTDDARAAAADQPCLTLEVVTATFDSAL